MKVYRLTDQEIIKLTNAMHHPTLVNLHGQPLQDANTRCGIVWKDIAAARNLDWESCCPVEGKGAEYFAAEEMEKETDE